MENQMDNGLVEQNGEDQPTKNLEETNMIAEHDANEQIHTYADPIMID